MNDPLFATPIPSGAMETPHDWDETTRKCKRCGATTTDWQNHKADHCTTQVASPNYRPGAAADDYSTINRRLGEIEAQEDKARGVALTSMAHPGWTICEQCGEPECECLLLISRAEMDEMRRNPVRGVPIYYCEETAEFYPLPPEIADKE